MASTAERSESVGLLVPDDKSSDILDDCNDVTLQSGTGKVDKHVVQDIDRDGADSNRADSDVFSARIHGAEHEHLDDSSGQHEDAEVQEVQVQRQPREMTKIQLANLWVMMVFMGSQLTLPFALAVFLVREIYKDGYHSEQKIAQLTGFLAAASSAARSTTALPWGMASDVVGRKIVMLVGLSASIISLLSFGSAHTYVGAILARLIPSFLIGTPVAIKSMMGDSCDSIGQAKAMTIFNLGHGLGAVIGPVLGGVLSYPCDRFDLPGCGANGIFMQRPFFLPCLVISCLGALAVLSSGILMKETQPDVIIQPGGWTGNLIRVMTFQKGTYSALTSDATTDGVEGTKGRFDVELGTVPLKEKFQLTDKTPLIQEENAESLEKPVEPPVQFKWYTDPGVRTSLIGAGLIALIYNFVDELSPIFISAKFDRGGLSMALDEFTWPLACSGIALAIFSLTLYHRLVKWIGPARLCRFGLVAGVVPALLLPIASLFTQHKVTALAFVYAAMIFRGPAKICALNSSQIIVNRLAGKKTMGRVNGAAMTLQSGGRALGPLLSGTVWAISVSLNIPFQQFLGFILVGIALVTVQFLYAGIQLPTES